MIQVRRTKCSAVLSHSCFMKVMISDSFPRRFPMEQYFVFFSKSSLSGRSHSFLHNHLSVESVLAGKLHFLWFFLCFPQMKTSLISSCHVYISSRPKKNPAKCSLIANNTNVLPIWLVTCTIQHKSIENVFCTHS